MEKVASEFGAQSQMVLTQNLTMHNTTFFTTVNARQSTPPVRSLRPANFSDTRQEECTSGLLFGKGEEAHFRKLQGALRETNYELF